VDPERASLAAEQRQSLAVGVLALAPLLVAYECSVLSLGGVERGGAELFLSAPLRPFGGWEGTLRCAFLLVILWGAYARVLHRGWSVAGTNLRAALEGGLLALLLGPLLLLVAATLDIELPGPALEREATGERPELARAALFFGVAAHEELLFRVGILGLAFLFARRLAITLGVSPGLARSTAELAGVAVSAVAFAAFHTEYVLSWLGPGGEAWDPARFTWRVLAGVALALIFRLRGLGVAGWTHALFNLSLLLGVGPGVMR